MKLTEIKKIEEILLLDQPLLKHRVTNLGAPAENKGSFLLNVELRLKNEKNFEEKFEVVAKLAVPNGNLIKIEAFKNELAFYKSIVPLLSDFLRPNGLEDIDLFPLYYGGRLTLNSRIKDTDKDALFFLENLKNSGYQTLDSITGCNLDTTKFVLKNLSLFHAVFLAIKTKKPEIFKHKIKPFINSCVDNGSTSDADTKQIISLMWEHEACVSLIPRIRRAMVQGTRPSSREPLATMIHNDFWRKNVMVKMEGDKTKKLKIVDFQQFDYGSPTADVLFFLFTSTDIPTLENSIDDLINYYYENLLSHLYQMDIETPLVSFKEFLKEVDTEARSSQFPHVMSKLRSVLSLENTPELKERVWYIVQEFAKRNWI